MKYLKTFNENIEDKEEFLNNIKDLIPDILNIDGINYIFNGDPEISKMPEINNHLKLYFKSVDLTDNKEIIKSDLSRVYKIISYEYEVGFIYNKYYHILLTLEDIIEILNNNYLRMGIDTISILFINKEKLYKESLSEKDYKFLDDIKDLIPDTFSLSKENSHKFNYTTKKYINPYHYISFDIDDIDLDGYDTIVSDLYRLYGILSNEYKISFSIEIYPIKINSGIMGYENHNDIDFKKCIEIINKAKSSKINITNLGIIFEK